MLFSQRYLVKALAIRNKRRSFAVDIKNNCYARNITLAIAKWKEYFGSSVEEGGKDEN